MCMPAYFQLYFVTAHLLYKQLWFWGFDSGGFKAVIKEQLPSILLGYSMVWFWFRWLLTGYSTSQLICTGASIRRKTQSNPFWDHPGSWCGVKTFAIHEVYTCWKIFLLTSRRLLPSPGEWTWSLVWLSSECLTITVEDDAEHRWLVLKWLLYITIELFKCVIYILLM